MPADKTELKILGPLAVLAVGAICAFMLLLALSSWDDDRRAKAYEETLVDNGVPALVTETEDRVTPVTIWDGAVAKIDNRYDRAWTSANIGDYLAHAGRFELVYVLGHEDQALYGLEADQEVNPVGWRRYAPAAAGLVRQIRALEAARGPFKPGPPASKQISRPIKASSILKINGGAMIVTATLVQPDFGTALPHSTRAPIIVTGEAVNGGLLKTFGDRFMLRDLKLSDHPDKSLADVPLRDRDGRPIAYLQWNPRQPGTVRLGQVFLPAVGFVSALVGIAAALFHRGRNAAQSLVASEARAKHMALHDALTGLPNRVLFADRLSHAIGGLARQQGAVGILCIDLDRFKDVNDTLGHQSGDELIREASARLSRVCRQNETLARLGGDEFAVVQAPATPDGAANLAQRIVQSLYGQVELSGGHVFLSGSVGVTLVTDPLTDETEAMRQADLALYRAKDLGRNQFAFFEPEMDAVLKTRKSLEHDLREAIAADKLELVYQPQFDRRDSLIGVEALVRWSHPDRGPISPALFVSIAEECGLIDKLSAATMGQAFASGARWPGLTIGINISPLQIRSVRFIDQIQGLLERTGANPRQFELEITESVLISDDMNTHETLKRLRAMGFRLALDDFGTGYSSLSYLRKYPIDKIKIDRSFIANLGSSADSDAVVRAIIKLAKALNLSIIAEGVETDDQRRTLLAAGCGEIQGYLTGKPAAPELIDDLVSAHLPQRRA